MPAIQAPRPSPSPSSDSVLEMKQDVAAQYGEVKDNSSSDVTPREKRTHWRGEIPGVVLNNVQGLGGGKSSRGTQKRQSKRSPRTSWGQGINGGPPVPKKSGKASRKEPQANGRSFRDRENANNFPPPPPAPPPPPPRIRGRSPKHPSTAVTDQSSLNTNKHSSKEYGLYRQIPDDQRDKHDIRANGGDAYGHAEGYECCPPPPHAGRAWRIYCGAQERLHRVPPLSQPPQQLQGNLTPAPAGSGALAAVGILVGVLGVLMWFGCVVHCMRYFRRYHGVSGRASDAYGGDGDIARGWGMRGGVGGGMRKISKGRGVRKGLLEAGLGGEKLTYSDPNLHRYNHGSEYHPYEYPHRSQPDEEEGDLEEKAAGAGDGQDEDEDDYVRKYGKPAGKVFLDGLVGSMKGGTWLRRVIGSTGTLGSPGNYRWYEVERAGSATWARMRPSGGGRGDCTGCAERDAEVGLRVRPGTGTSTPNPRKQTPNSREQTPIRLPPRGNDVSWDGAEKTLAFRREAVLRSAAVVRGRYAGANVAAEFTGTAPPPESEGW